MSDLTPEGAGSPPAASGAPDAPSGNRLAEGIFAAVLSAFLLWGVRLFPLLAFAALPAAAIPLARFGARRGVPAALASTGAAAVLAALLALSLRATPAQAAAEAGVEIALAGACAIAAALSRDHDASRMFLALAAYGSLLASAMWISSPSAPQELRAVFDASEKAWLESSRQSGADPAALAAVRHALDSAREMAIRYAPGFFSALWVILAAVVFYLGRRWAPLSRGSFSALRLPPGLAAVFVLSGAGAFLLEGAARTASRDLLAPVAVLYFLCGLSIITHFARRWFRMTAMRVVLYVGACWFPFSAVTAGLGLFDWYFDFRRRAESRGPGRTP